MNVTAGNVPPPDQHVPSPPSYSHSILITGTPSKRLVISGQVGQRPSGVPSTFKEQVSAIYENLGGILTANGMSWTDVIKTSVFIVAGKTQDETVTRINDFRNIRDVVLRDHFGGPGQRNPPASTLLVVSALASPAFLAEVEAEAVQ